ncbi:LruC domain-containing protein, partial [Parabacteroides distasonis]|nr:LruC domain-containing protein [Parabacteroides distasonis]
DLYPYVLDIPYSENKPFRWCIENKSIDNAYNFDQDYRKEHGDWYETPKDESLVIKFTTSDEEKKEPENKE